MLILVHTVSFASIDITLKIPDNKIKKVSEFVNYTKPVGFKGTDKAWLKQYIKNIFEERLYLYERNEQIDTQPDYGIIE